MTTRRSRAPLLLAAFAAVAGCLGTDGRAAEVREAEGRTAGARGASGNASAVHPWCTGHAAQVLTLTADSLGPVTPATTRDQLARACPTVRDTVSADAEGNEYPASLLRFGGTDAGLAEWTAEGRLQRIRVLSPQVRTAEGLRVGSTVAEVRRTLGPLTAGNDDAGVYVWSQAAPRLSYLLRWDAAAALGSPDHVAGRPEAIPDSATVREVLFDPTR